MATKTSQNPIPNPIPNPARDQYNIVVVGHVDHGKSTVIGRLLADTGSLPEGKLDQVRRDCERNAKPFEYAFLLDALKAEQAQGITIDTARCFFKGKHRDYIIIDAPGHIEFLKNMVTGAARAEAAVLVIDAKEGVRENSRRHGYMLSLLGIRQVVVAVNKMDLAGYSRERFVAIEQEYRDFLAQVGLVPAAFVPVAAFHGVNLSAPSPAELPWYSGKSLLDHIDAFAKAAPALAQPLRLPVQDVYKFTEAGDERRIIAGRIETGTVRAGDAVVFLPSGKQARVKTLETFNRAVPEQFGAGESVGLTLEPEIYVRGGEVMVRQADQAGPGAMQVGSRFRANIFWMGRQPLVKGRKYKIKLGTAESPVWVEDIRSVLDASDLSMVRRDQVEQHEVGECLLETFKPLAWDAADRLAQTGRFVLVDGYEIAGGGILLGGAGEGESRLERQLRQRELAWERTAITRADRAERLGQAATLVLLTGPDAAATDRLGRDLEARLFAQGRLCYYLGLRNTRLGLRPDEADRSDLVHRLGELAHLFTDAGLMVLASVPDLEASELAALEVLARPAGLRTILVGPDGSANLEAGAADLVLEAGQDAASQADHAGRWLADIAVLPAWTF